MNEDPVTPPEEMSPLEAALKSAQQRLAGRGTHIGLPQEEQQSKSAPAPPVAAAPDSAPAEAWNPAAPEATTVETYSAPFTPPLPINPVAAPASAAAAWSPRPADAIPLLPRGRPIFDQIPAAAVVLEALGQAVKDGAVITRNGSSIGVILLRGGQMLQQNAFVDGNRLSGGTAFATIKSWTSGVVSAFAFPPEVVEVLPLLMSGEPCYEDLSLRWTDWSGLLQDLSGREESYVIELDTPDGRGVTCISGGRQVATYTEAHPDLGEPTLLNQLAQGSRGTIWVWREGKAGRSDEAELTAAPAMSSRPAPAVPAPAPAPASEPEPEPAFESAGFMNAEPAPAHNPFAESAGFEAVDLPNIPGGAQAAEDAFDTVFASPRPEPASPASLAVPSSPEVVEELKLMARERLQRSATRVEALLDEASAENRPLPQVLTDIRQLVIRGVMQSTLDQLVDEMMSRAQQMSAS